MLEEEGRTYVVDAGPDFRQQMLRENVQNLDAILITHEHKDHIGGMDDVRAFNFKSRKAIDIYCDSRVEQAIKREYPYVFDPDGYPGAPRMNLNLIEDHPFTLFGREVIPVMAYHKDLPVLGFRFDDLTYLTDVNAMPEKSISLIEGTELLIINALRKEKHPSHFNLDEALELVTLIKPRKAYIIHIGHQMGLHNDVKLELPGNVELAYDGQVFYT